MVEQFVVGIVRGTHGITGEFKVESTSGEYEHFANMEEVTLTDGNVEKVFQVEYTQEAATTLYMKLAGINTPEDAAKFNRWQIVVPRKNAHPLQENEWYIEDLKGCSVWYDETAGKIPLDIEADLIFSAHFPACAVYIKIQLCILILNSAGGSSHYGDK